MYFFDFSLAGERKLGSAKSSVQAIILAGA